MTYPAAKAQKAAAKWNATLDKLRAEIAKREASGRQTKALDLAKARLARAERYAATARWRVETLARKRLAREAKAARQAAGDAAMGRRLDKIAAAAPRVMKRWKQDRKDEPKRIDKRRKQLVRRITKDLRQQIGREEWSPELGGRRLRAAAPPPEEAATFPTGPIVPYVPPKASAPDRVGLLPGDFRLVERAVDDFDNYRQPKDWTPEHVGRRMAEAFAVLRRLPMTIRPKEFGANWPEYINVGVELAFQAGAGTLLMGRNRVVGGTSADEVARMNAALGWPLAYLLNLPNEARALNEWAFAEASGKGSELNGLALEGARVIAERLNEIKEQVR